MGSTVFSGSLAAVIGAAFLSLATPAQAASLWDESVDGDLSSDGLAPTQLGELTEGSNLLSAVFNAGSIQPDPDYFTFIVPTGFALEGIELLDWEATPEFEDIAFSAIQEGDVFDYVVPADRSNADGLLGWSHLRSTQVGTNKILIEFGASSESHIDSGVAEFYAEEVDLYPDDLVAANPELPGNLLALTDQWVPGATGFELPLSAGTYSMWLRQGSDTNIATDFDFKLAAGEPTASTPEPSAAIALLALTLGAFAVKRR